MITIGRVWQTVRHLTLRQLVWQVVHRLRSRGRLRLPDGTPETHFLPVPDAANPVSWQPGVFTFLNRSVHFPSTIDWNYPNHGKLWTYNLTYFDYLNQPGMTADQGLAFIHEFIHQSNVVRDGLEAYPTSLRIQNWVQFLSRHRVRDTVVERHLFAQVTLLNRRFEHHLSGNHLLENGFALLTGGLFFRQERWTQKAAALIGQGLTEQILPDGGHYERSPVYHQLLLNRLLDTLQMVQGSGVPIKDVFTRLLLEKGELMRGWLDAVTFRNGDVPMVNDAAPGFAPGTPFLRQKALSWLPNQLSVPLSISGFRMFRQERYELFVNAGSVGPAHQPGHAHADTFSFVLYVDNLPIIVDNSVSTYQIGPRRDWERSTAAHNTVTIDNGNTSDVWASFRVGHRARVTLLTDTPATITARHDGYRHRGILHERSWLAGAEAIQIIDRLLRRNTGTEAIRSSGIARFYFHPSVHWQWLNAGTLLRAGPLTITFCSATKPTARIEPCELADGFNRLVPGHCLAIAFTTYLKTTITVSA